jgi:NADH-quinone oxidoreductase subunit H
MDQATLRFLIQLGIIGLTFFMLINASALLVLAERKIMGFMQQRYGPYLVGPHGLLQPLADILKLLFKEELRPKDADKWLFTLAPIVSVHRRLSRRSPPFRGVRKRRSSDCSTRRSSSASPM